jgi:hypothetical protein
MIGMSVTWTPQLLRSATTSAGGAVVMKQKSSEPGASTWPVGQFGAWVRRQVELLVAELERDALVRTEHLARHAEHALIPRRHGLDVTAVDHDVVDTIDRDPHRVPDVV